MYRHHYPGSNASTPSSSRRSSSGSSDMDRKGVNKPGSGQGSKVEEVKGRSIKKSQTSFSRTPVKMASVAKPRSATHKKDRVAEDAGEDLSHPTVAKGEGAGPADRSNSRAPKDLMISYSHADKDMMLRVREKLEQNGITVWVDVSGLSAGVDFLSKIGEAIIDAKLFISLLSTNCVNSRYCQDELALAYVSDTGIFPVAIEDPANFKSKMDTGMKLQLARYEWTYLDEENFNEKCDELIDKLKAELKRRTTEEGRPKLERGNTRHNLNKTRESGVTGRADGEGEDTMPEKFWKDHFHTADVIPFKQFEDVLMQMFRAEIEEYFPSPDMQQWLLDILKREMEVEEDGKLFKYNFDAFCMIDGLPEPVWTRVFSQAMESNAMKDVFNMESSVRVEAIENLGKFRSAAVIDALRDLLSDLDANVRAVASVSLARTEANDPVTLKFLMKTLNDKDRLVREAGCLALGHLQAKQAVSRLLHLWRNDVISHVREAAQVALQQIGGAEVEKAMHVTKVLADEIRQLTTH